MSTNLKLGKTKTAETPAQIEKRKRVWRHNSFIGHATMMRRQAIAMIEADSTSELARELAFKIQDLSAQLIQELKTRIDIPIPVG